MFTRSIRVAAAVALLLLPTSAGAQSDARTSFNTLLNQEARSWRIYTYENWSVGEPSTMQQSQDGRSVVNGARFRYGHGEEDMITVTLEDGQRTCVKYHNYDGDCGLPSYGYDDYQPTQRVCETYVQGYYDNGGPIYAQRCYDQ